MPGPASRPMRPRPCRRPWTSPRSRSGSGASPRPSGSLRAVLHRPGPQAPAVAPLAADRDGSAGPQRRGRPAARVALGRPGAAAVGRRRRPARAAPRARRARLRALPAGVQPQPARGRRPGRPGEDDRLALAMARAYLATRAGDFGRAEAEIRGWLERRPDDPAVWKARLDWAVAAGRPGAGPRGDGARPGSPARRRRDPRAARLARPARWRRRGRTAARWKSSSGASRADRGHGPPGRAAPAGRRCRRPPCEHEATQGRHRRRARPLHPALQGRPIPRSISPSWPGWPIGWAAASRRAGSGPLARLRDPSNPSRAPRRRASTTRRHPNRRPPPAWPMSSGPRATPDRRSSARATWIPARPDAARSPGSRMRPRPPDWPASSRTTAARRSTSSPRWPAAGSACSTTTATGSSTSTASRAGPSRPAPRIPSTGGRCPAGRPAVSQPRRRDLRGRHGAIGHRGHAPRLRARRRRRRLRQRRPARPVRDPMAILCPVPQSGRRDVRGCHRAPPAWTATATGRPRPRSPTSTTTAIWTSMSVTTACGIPEHPLICKDPSGDDHPDLRPPHGSEPCPTTFSATTAAGSSTSPPGRGSSDRDGRGFGRRRGRPRRRRAGGPVRRQRQHGELTCSATRAACDSRRSGTRPASRPMPAAAIRPGWGWRAATSTATGGSTWRLQTFTANRRRSSTTWAGPLRRPHGGRRAGGAEPAPAGLRGGLPRRRQRRLARPDDGQRPRQRPAARCSPTR